MSDAEPSTPDPTNPFDQLLGEYLQRIDRGEQVDREDLLAQHPEFAEELLAYFADEDAFDGLAGLDETQDMTRPNVGPRPGQLGVIRYFGDYELLGEIGHGGMGVVYKARQRSLNRLVAVKMILAGHLAQQEYIERFYREAKAAGQLQHRHIVAVHEVGEHQNHHYFSMDYIEGRSLSELVREHPLPSKQAARYLQKVAEAIEYAHQQGTLHRDLKPSNILVDGNDEPLVTDFGLAKSLEANSSLTGSRPGLGTPSYMSPEQAEGQGAPLGPWSDVYSLGATLYDLVTGRAPFRAESPAATLVQVLHQEPVSPRLLNRTIDRDIETICLKCLEKDPRRRYQTAQELADELQRYLDGRPIHARPIGVTARTYRWCRRNPLAVATIASLALALLIFAVGYFATDAARKDAVAARQKAHRYLQDATQAVNELYETVSTNTLLNEPGMQPLRHRLLERARQYYERFSKISGNDPAAEQAAAMIYYPLARIQADLGAHDEAFAIYCEGRNRTAAWLVDHPNDLAVLEAHGSIANELGILFEKQGDLAATATAYQQALAARQRLAALAPEKGGLLANTRMNRGLLYERQYRALSQEQRIEQAGLDLLAAARDDFRTAQSLRLELIRSAEDRNEDSESVLMLRCDLGRGQYNAARLEYLARAETDAKELYKEAVETFKSVLSDSTLAAELTGLNTLETKALLGTCLRVLGDSQRQKEPEAALERYREAVDVLATLVEQNPTVPGYREALADLHRSIGATAAQATAAEPPETVARAFRRAAELSAGLALDFPDEARYDDDLAQIFDAISRFVDEKSPWQRSRSAITDLTTAIDNLKAVYPDDPEIVNLREILTRAAVEIDNQNHPTGDPSM